MIDYNITFRQGTFYIKFCKNKAGYYGRWFKFITESAKLIRVLEVEEYSYSIKEEEFYRNFTKLGISTELVNYYD